MKNKEIDFEQTDDFGIDLSEISFDTDDRSKPKKEEAEKVISQTLQSFKDRAEKEKARFEKVTDSEYWFCVYFQTREEKESFLTNAGLIDYGDKYIDGWDVANKMGIAIDKDITGYPQIKKPDPELVALV